MATISSPGIGSGLDVKSIVSQLVELERQPLTRLQVEAASVQARISTYGEIKSLVSALGTAAGNLNSLTTWNSVKATSSRPESVTATATGGTAANSFSVRVDNIAKQQSFASASISGGGVLGAGTLTIQPGSFDTAVASPFPFTGAGAPITITVSATDTLADVASKINDLKGAVQATILNDGTGERLLLRSRDTGVAAGFEVSVADSDANLADTSGLSRLLSNGLGNSSLVTQYAEDARITVNNSISVTSASNTFTNVIAGVTLNIPSSATTGPTSVAEVRVEPNQESIRTAINGFVDAFNKLNSFIAEATKFDSGTRTAGLLQADSFAIGIQRSIRGIVQSSTAGSTFARLSEVGVSIQLDGSLSVDSSKLNAAIAQPDELRNLFRADNQNDLTNGVGLKIKKFADGLLNADGLLRVREDSLKRSLERNSEEQLRVNEKAARAEAALNRRYSALDAQLASLTALNNYVAQQVTMWNNQKRE